MTTVTPKTRSLSGDQQHAVERARDFLRAAAAGPHTLATDLDVGPHFHAARPSPR